VPAGDIVAAIAALAQPAAFCALTVCVLFAARPGQEVAPPYAPPSKLNNSPAVGLLTLSVPETDPQVEPVTDNTGDDGVDGWVLITMLADEGDVHLPDVAVAVYVPSGAVKLLPDCTTPAGMKL